MSREAFDIDAALEKCHKGTAWQRDLIRAQLIAAQADAFERAASVCLDMSHERRRPLLSPYAACIRNARAAQCADAIRALAKEATNA